MAYPHPETRSAEPEINIASQPACVVDGVLPVHSNYRDPIWIRQGEGPDAKWLYGTAARSATEAMVLVNYVRRTQPNLFVRTERVSAK